MKKENSRIGKLIKSIFEEAREDYPDDIDIIYTVTKKEGSYPDTKLLINCIITYVQNSEIYFKKNIGFVHGVLVFAIVGEEKEHKKLQDILGKDIEKLDCKLEWE